MGRTELRQRFCRFPSLLHCPRSSDPHEHWPFSQVIPLRALAYPLHTKTCPFPSSRACRRVVTSDRQHSHGLSVLLQGHYSRDAQMSKKKLKAHFKMFTQLSYMLNLNPKGSSKHSLMEYIKFVQVCYRRSRWRHSNPTGVIYRIKQKISSIKKNTLTKSKCPLECILGKSSGLTECKKTTQDL